MADRTEKMDLQCGEKKLSGPKMDDTRALIRRYVLDYSRFVRMEKRVGVSLCDGCAHPRRRLLLVVRADTIAAADGDVTSSDYRVGVWILEHASPRQRMHDAEAPLSLPRTRSRFGTMSSELRGFEAGG